MKLVRLRLCNFRSFGPDPTEIALDSMTYILGPNGTGKTAVLQALARMFSLDPIQRKVKKSDFNVPVDELPGEEPEERTLWIEADFEFPELEDYEAPQIGASAIPVHFAHMQLLSADGPVQVRFRLKATIDQESDIEESLTYVMRIDENGSPLEETRVAKQERNSIQVHYLPARRDPTDHISFSANTLLGRVLRAANWTEEREPVSSLTRQISDSLADNAAILGLSNALTGQWRDVHKGGYFVDPCITFTQSEIEGLLRHLSVGFTPGHGENLVDVSRLSDGQQSLLYLSLVLATQDIGRKVLGGELAAAFDVHKLRPAVFTILAVEEPENSLSPHYLGRLARVLAKFSENSDAQALAASHSPALLRRAPPESIRYLRLSERRQTVVKRILLPKKESQYKFIREGVQAFPELYFSRFVVLGEGASEEIVLPRILEARGILADDASVCVVPLAGRHVNHFWRLLNELGIPHVTLLDLDLGRNQGGWGRVKYAAKQLLRYVSLPEEDFTEDQVNELPDWNDEANPVLDDEYWLSKLEEFGVFFSAPLDLDFMIMQAYPEAYRVEKGNREVPDMPLLKAVLGSTPVLQSQYLEDERSYFAAYHQKFQLGSKPTWHLRAMASLSGLDITQCVPAVLQRMGDRIEQLTRDLPE